MFKFTGKLLSLTAATLMVSTAISSAQSMDELVAAAKAEGQLTTIALPHDWCGYGAVIDAFKASNCSRLILPPVAPITSGPNTRFTLCFSFAIIMTLFTSNVRVGQLLLKPLQNLKNQARD